MNKADVQRLAELLPKGRQPMFKSLRDAGVRGAPPATNVRWINVTKEGTPILNMWRDDIRTFIRGRPVARIWPRTWEVKSSAGRRYKREAVIEMLAAYDGSYIRVVVLERRTSNYRKHTGTRFDSNARWRVQKTGGTFRLFRSRPGEVCRETPPVILADVGNLKPSKREVRSMRIERSNKVRRRTLERANGRCENPRCADHGHYASMDVHHVTFLGRRGADHTRNTVALCPACHTRVHRGNAQVRKRFHELLKRILKRQRRGNG
jgi:HNH endonuclease